MRSAHFKVALAAVAVLLFACVWVTVVFIYLKQPPATAIKDVTATEANAMPVPAGQSMVTIGGIVQNEQSQPLADVRVNLQWQLPAGQRNIQGPGTAVKRAQTATDAGGRWHYANVPRESLGTLYVHLTDKDYSAATIVGVPAEQLTGQTAVMTMSRGVDLSGVVVDSGGRPVSGATVTTPTDMGWRDSGSPMATTDGDGHFALRHVPANATVKILTRAAQFAPAAQAVKTSAPVASVRIVLTAGRTLRGIVADSGGRPISGARVEVNNWDGGFNPGIQTTTAWDGSYALSHVPDGELQIDAGKSGFTVGIETASDRQEQLNFRLSSLATFRGAVVDARTGKPIPEFKVFFNAVRNRESGPPTFPAWSGQTFRDGRYEVTPERLAGTISGWRLRVEAHGYLPVNSGVLHDSAAQDFSLAPGADLEGHVFGPDGKPAAGVVVEIATADATLAVYNGQFTNLPRPLCVTDSGGHFDFPAQTPPFVAAAVSADGFAEADSAALAKGGDLHMTAWGRINGRLLVGGKPAADEQMGAMLAADVHGFQRRDPYVFISMFAKTDADGRFTFDPVTPGDLIVYRTSVRGFNGTEEAVTVAPGATVELTLGASCRAVTGRLVIPKELASSGHWRLTVYAETDVKFPTPPKMPDSVQKLPPAMRFAWLQAFALTDAGKAYEAALEKTRLLQHHYDISVDSEGKSTCPDVRPGKYYLVALMMPAGGGVPLGVGRANFTVTPSSAGDDGPVMIPDVTIAAGDGSR